MIAPSENDIIQSDISERKKQIFNLANKLFSEPNIFIQKAINDQIKIECEKLTYLINLKSMNISMNGNFNQMQNIGGINKNDNQIINNDINLNMNKPILNIVFKNEIDGCITVKCQIHNKISELIGIYENKIRDNTNEIKSKKYYTNGKRIYPDMKVYEAKLFNGSIINVS